MQVVFHVGERAIPSPKVQNEGKDQTCHVYEGYLEILQCQEESKEDEDDPQEVKQYYEITQQLVDHHRLLETMALTPHRKILTDP